MTREQTTIPNIEFTTATGRYDESRSPIDLIVLHSTAGTLQSTISLFSSTPQPGKETSAHYVIENDGKLYQGLEEYFTAYHCGNLEKNRRSIGIEHVDNGPTVKLHTDAQYAMSAKLVKEICTFYNIPIDSAHIIPHSSVVATACPNGLDVARIIREASGSTPPTDDCLTKLTQVTQERDRLNKVIEGKDETISHLGDTINAKNAEIARLSSDVTVQSNQVLDLTSRLNSVTEQSKKIPEMQTLISAQEESIKSLRAEIETLTRSNAQLKNKYDTVKKPIQKLILLIAEKAGINIV